MDAPLWVRPLLRPLVAAVVSIAVVGAGVLLLWPLAIGLGWGKLEVVSTHTAFFQAWIYLLQTVALFGTLVYIAMQTRSVERAVTANTVQMMVAAHRELLGKAVEKPELHAALMAEDLPKDAALRPYLSMWLNHGFNAYSLHEAGYIDAEWWEATRRDMRDVLGHGGMKAWWARVKKFYPARYQRFIDEEILDGREGRGCSGH
ncbi:MAG: hypothetical protein ACRD1X_01895 [Vicinamibacteria bacterium]